MKLAEALNERADIQRRIAQLKARLLNNSKVQEGEKPAEDPKDLLDELNFCVQRLEELIARINKTNCEAKDGSVSITELIAHRDVLAQKLGIYRDFLNSASSVVNRITKTEIKIQPSVDVRALQKQIDMMSKAYRETDTKIQELNWTTELL
ncbi:MAG: DIP1984 family protein [Ruminococcus sp.]|nr:DIP1984 family protein [Ruminococcus sp.]